MSFLSNLLKKLFGEKPQQVEQPIAAPDDYWARWEKERQERIQLAESRLKPWIIAALKENKSLAFSWESGNDEAFVTFDNRSEDEAIIFEDLEEYIVDKLAIPDAGEFQMNGSGSIYLANNLVKVNYRSTMKEIVDFNEDTEEEIYGEEVLDSGEALLFSI